jgi:MYXO-CTERM domain-containing protein
MASCSGACSVGCDKQCNIEPPTATCDARCKASCQGSCKVETNIQCQVDCQAKGYAKCEAEVTGGCKARCMANEGALFCDGNFVDTGDKLEECVDALKAVLDAKVMTSSSGSADCAGGACNAEGEASVSSSCSVAQVGADPAKRTGLVALGSLLVLGLFFWRRRA